MSRSLRCAIYTRKSSEEGLDQAFNSLDAQREAGLDYIRSQKHQGWLAISTTYDDGGYSGGSMQRPALQKLLADIDAGRVDIVVVYKVDRLSRSLADFARLMQAFDARGVSFVSVTQQFNTTTSMGRLTLNMLLSFAQFEREVAGERIRDKIAATMKKGVWVCGRPPLGYRRSVEGEARGIVIIPEEAEVVRQIFRGYAELGSLVALAERMAARRFVSKKWVSKDGQIRGGLPLSTSTLYGILTNPLYIGKITHTRRMAGAGRPGEKPQPHTDVYDGVHEPIVSRDLWDRVHEKMARAERETRHRWTHTHLLKGLLRTMEGFAMSPSSVQRSTDSSGKPLDHTRLVRYYTSQKAIKQGYASCPVKSINAEHLDTIVRGLVLDYLASTGHQTPIEDPSKRDHLVRDLIQSVVVAPDQLEIVLGSPQCVPTEKPASQKKPKRVMSVPHCVFQPAITERDGNTVLTLAINIRKIDGRRMLLAPNGQDLLAHQGASSGPEPNQTIVNALGLAYAALRAITDEGLRTAEVAARFRTAESTIKYILPLTQLGPAILRAALQGTLPPRITVKRLRVIARHLDWQRQSAALANF